MSDVTKSARDQWAFDTGRIRGAMRRFVRKSMMIVQLVYYIVSSDKSSGLLPIFGRNINRLFFE